MIQIEINLSKLERGTHKGRVKVTRGGKTFWREQRLGRQEIDAKSKVTSESIHKAPALFFDSYADALKYVDDRAKDYSSKNEFYSSEEYKKLFPILKNIHKIEIDEWAKSAESAMSDVDVKYGDEVEYSHVTPFGVEIYTGKVVSRKGIPHVKFDVGQTTIDGKKSTRWHKGWRKSS